VIISPAQTPGCVLPSNLKNQIKNEKKGVFLEEKRKGEKALKKSRVGGGKMILTPTNSPKGPQRKIKSDEKKRGTNFWGEKDLAGLDKGSGCLGGGKRL